ncbi:lipoyl(octanoyl) transferase [Teladorsagia circumcincta]|uniref:lipoyl(octanoyl) transferase n=1 Tax=Teladorsagia circumcincta TaxID=45464 RepID=A0A2G9U4M0_TELCI|nr:lipoyl(octanoyl) transferase [Teladorsagia circumcincta]
MHCIRSKLYSQEEETRLKGLGADFFRTSRGGLITFHGPGQLVMYPIFDLKRIAPRPIGVRRYVEMLEQVIINCATEDFHISNVGRTQHTGVWVGENRKLAALGIAVSHGVSYHGLALNCNTDLGWYDHVVGCGIEGAEATSLSRECHRDVSIEETVPKMVEQFASVFSCDVA